MFSEHYQGGEKKNLWPDFCYLYNFLFISWLQEFVINTPDFEAAKFWVGNMGKHATHAVLYAQLYTPDGQCQGLHPFIVQVG